MSPKMVCTLECVGGLSQGDDPHVTALQPVLRVTFFKLRHSLLADLSPLVCSRTNLPSLTGLEE